MEYYVEHILKYFVIPEFLLIFLVLVVTLFLHRFYYDLHTPFVSSVKDRVSEFLTTLIFSEADEATMRIEIEKFKNEIPLRQRWCKKIVVHKLMFLKQNLKGDVTKDLHYIYECFDLYRFTLTYLKSWFWYRKCKGLEHLRELEYTKGKDYVLRFKDSKNETLSSNAYTALMFLESNNLEFLIDYSHSTNYAGEIKIIDFLQHNKPPMPKNLDKWIYREEVTTIVLGLKFMIFYNYTAENNKILELLWHDDWTVRHEAIHAVGSLPIFDGEDDLIYLFYREDNYENKIEILESLKMMGSEDAQRFMAILLKSDEIADIKLKAVFCLNETNPTFLNMEFKGDNDIEKMIKHVNIKYI